MKAPDCKSGTQVVNIVGPSPTLPTKVSGTVSRVTVSAPLRSGQNRCPPDIVAPVTVEIAGAAPVETAINFLMEKETKEKNHENTDKQTNFTETITIQSAVLD